MRGDIAAGPYHHKHILTQVLLSSFWADIYFWCAKFLSSSPTAVERCWRATCMSLWEVCGGGKAQCQNLTNVKHLQAACFFRLKTFIWGWWCQSKQWSWTQTLYFLNVPTFYFVCVQNRLNFSQQRLYQVVSIHLCRICTKSFIQDGADGNFTCFKQYLLDSTNTWHIDVQLLSKYYC